jgi:hypothetical protein
MPVVRSFPSAVSVQDLVPILDSLGAHVAAKLDHFATDERTLTDELCDMFYIWAQSPNRRQTRTAADRRPLPLPIITLPVVLSKTTQQEEAVIGCDLALAVTSPDGVKRALIQVKVFDPIDDRLRCDSTEGWDKLWSQLVLMQKRNGELSFLLLYVPGSKLDGAGFGYGTWEQGLSRSGRPSRTSARLGATFIPVSDLLDSAGNWRHAPPVAHVGDGVFYPSGISFSRLLLDMLACRRGAWASPDGTRSANTRDHDGYPVHYRPYREIGLSFAEAPIDDWRALASALRNTSEDDTTP